MFLRTPHTLVSLTILIAAVAIGSPTAGASRTLHVTPAGPSLAVLRNAGPGATLHVSAPEVNGELSLSADSVRANVTIDFRRMARDRFSDGRLADAWLYEALTYPHPMLRISISGALPSATAPGAESELPAASVTILRGDRVQRVTVHASLNQPADTTAGAAIVSASIPVDAALLGLDRGDYADAMPRLVLDLTISGASFPWRVRARSYEEAWYGAYRVARDLRYTVIGPEHVVLASLGWYGDDLAEPLALMSVSADSLQAALAAHLREGSPDRRLRGRPVTPEAQRMYDMDAHVEALQLGHREVTPVHYLLALLRRTDDPTTRFLNTHCVTYERLRGVYEGSPAPAAEVTLLGNPFYQALTDSAAMRYARNVWDMQLWNGRIYLGSGNSSNNHPARNAGPVPLYSLNPRTASFDSEYVVNDEQIHRYRVIGSDLVVPGHDPLESWDLGNFYRLRDGAWDKVRTIPRGIHNYDMFVHDGALFASLGTARCGKLGRSTDGGETWTIYDLPGVFRGYELFTCGGDLYVSCYAGALFRFTGDRLARVHANLFPGAVHGPMPIVARSARLGGSLVYLGADNVNDHQWVTFGAYRAERIGEAEPLNIPADHVPYDVLVRDGTAYVLTNRIDDDAGTATMVIYGSQDLRAWTEIVRCSLPSFARSFEYVDGAFYVGLGTETDPLNAASGNVYRIVPRSR